MAEQGSSAHQLTTKDASSSDQAPSTTGHHHLPHVHHSSMNPDASSESATSTQHKNPLGTFHHDSPSDFQPVSGTTHYQDTPDSNIKQSSAAAPHGQGVSRVTTDGNLVQSDDPSTNPNASLGQKLVGDVKGAVRGTMGSLQAATGAALRNKGLEERGLEKMQTEDERLGAKAGVMPVGSSRREGTRDA